MRPLSAFLMLVVMITEVGSAQQQKPAACCGAAPSTQDGGIAFSAKLVRQLTAIREAALADDYAYQQVAHLAENIGPRSTGSSQAQAAVEYVAKELRALGL